MVAFSNSGRGPKGLVIPGGVPEIDWDDPITDSLLGCYVVTGEGGASKPFIRDLVTGNILTTVGSPSIVSGKTGMQAQDASGAGWTSNVPVTQKVTGAFSVMWSGSILGTGSLTDNPPLFACSYANSYTSPYNAWGITRASSQTIVFLYWNQGGNVEEVAVSAALTTGGNYCVLGSNYPGGTGYCWINGRLGSYSSSGTSSAISYGTSPQIRVGLNINGTNWANAGMSIGALWGRQLGKGESARMTTDPASFLLYPTSKVFYILGGYHPPTTVSPTAGSIVFTGETPAVTTGNTVAPAHGSIVFTGETPSVVRGNTLSPAHGSIIFTGETPAVTTGNTLSPAHGSIVFTGETPSVEQGSEVSPGAGSVVFTGETPAITTGNTLSPAHGSIVFTGETPTVSFTNTVSPAAGSIVFTGETPSVTTGNTLAPAHGSIVFTGETPSVDNGGSIAPSAGCIVFTGETPSVTTGNTLAPAHGSIVFTGETPSVKAGNTLSPSSGSILFTGETPSVAAGNTVSPSAGSIVFTGETPVVSTGGNTVSPSAGSIVFTGETPSVSVGGVVIPAPTAWTVIRRNEPEYGRIDDEDFAARTRLIKARLACEYTQGIQLLSSTYRSGSGTSSAINTSGATLLVMSVQSSSSVTLSDNLSNTWILSGTIAQGGSGDPHSAIYFVPAPTTSGTQTFSVSGSNVIFQVSAWIGTATVNPLVNSNWYSNGSAGTPFSNVGVSQVPGSLVIGSANAYIAGMSPQGGYNYIGLGSGTNSYYGVQGYQVTNTTGQHSISFGGDSYAAATIAVFTPPLPVTGGITLLNQTNGWYSGADAGTYAIDTTGADLLVATIGFGNTTGSVSDTAGNTWTQAGTTAYSFDNNTKAAIFYVSNPTTSTTHAFSGIPGSGAMSIQVTAWSGVNNIGSPLLGSTSSGGATGTSIQPGSITPTLARALVISACAVGPGGITSVSEMLLTTATDTTTSYPVQIGQAYTIQSAAVAINPTWSFNEDSYPAATMAAFGPASYFGSQPAFLRVSIDNAIASAANDEAEGLAALIALTSSRMRRTLGASVNLSLTGVRSTSGAGNLSAGVSPSLIGVRSTLTAHSVTSDVEPTPSGVIGTLTAHNLGVSGSTALWGVVVRSAIGRLAPTITPNMTDVYLVGAPAITGRVGSLIAKESSAITGVISTTHVGNVSVITLGQGFSLWGLTANSIPIAAEDTDISIRWSDTAGASWNNPVTRTLGLTGNYLTNIQVRRLGYSRNRVYEISWACDAPTALQGIWVEFTEAQT